MFPKVTLELPAWVSEIMEPGRIYETQKLRMELAIKLASENIRHQTGGPFGAAIFEIETGKLIAPGVNIVVPGKCSVAHAEAVAIMIAEQVIGSFDLGSGTPLELVTSSQPCIQCFGMTHWSGVRRLVIGATGEDVENLTGFDEGPLPQDWKKALANRDPLPPCEVITGVLQHESCLVLQEYKDGGGLIYNAGSTKPAK
jgi:tRNA(Arg) A34 adenosine deaminase TadA